MGVAFFFTGVVKCLLSGCIVSFAERRPKNEKSFNFLQFIRSRCNLYLFVEMQIYLTLYIVILGRVPQS